MRKNKAKKNRTYALSKANGKPVPITATEKLNLTDNHFYFILPGELYTGTDNVKAKQNFQKAFSLARTKTDEQAIQKKIDNLTGRFLY